MGGMRAGEPAPDFSLPDQEGREIHLHDLGGQPVVLFFYPRASTSGCTLEARGFRDAHARFRRRGVAVLGASPDTVKAQKRFAESEKLPFPLLADADRSLCQRYGVLQEKSMYGRKFLGVVRTTFLIGADGVIRRVFEKVTPAGHADAVLQALADAFPKG